ncbi:hypothetical protein DNTS_029664 [Danionella cerebrum]|uniref:EPCAM/Trop-2 C-terminal domain-containing protein n=1 Tax=Danionella cerebrum TaxID=2873325 RepID=A0A553QFP0_9TELE|nr:hypothetical protein DNTS_029664 [Danionella translucida]
MKLFFAVCVVALLETVASQCTCQSMKWATCDDSCVCTLPFADNYKQTIDCTKLIPKCFLMKAEMYRAKKNMSTRSIVCWCVNSAGVRRSDKGDKNIKCEPVETIWVRLELKHKPLTTPLDATKLKTGIQNAMLERYNLDKSLVSEVQYDQDGRLIVVDVKKDEKDRVTDLSRATYYLEKDIKVLPLFLKNNPFEVSVEGNKVSMENVLVYYVDEKAPTFTMQRLTGGIIAVIVVVSLIVIAGLLILFFLARRQKAAYTKTQARELEPIS